MEKQGTLNRNLKDAIITGEVWNTCVSWICDDVDDSRAI